MTSNRSGACANTSTIDVERASTIAIEITTTITIPIASAMCITITRTNNMIINT